MYLGEIPSWLCLVLLLSFRFCFGFCWAFWGYLATSISVSPRVAFLCFFLGLLTSYAQNTWQILKFRRSLQASNEHNQDSQYQFPTLISLSPSCLPVAGHCAVAFSSPPNTGVFLFKWSFYQNSKTLPTVILRVTVMEPFLWKSVCITAFESLQIAFFWPPAISVSVAWGALKQR